MLNLNIRFARVKRFLKGAKANIFPQSKQVIEFAFECGGIKYYQHADFKNIPNKRALKAVTIYAEMDSGCDAYYLQKHTEAVDEIFSGSKIGLEEINKIKRFNEHMKERLKLPPTEIMILKLASIRFFDESENPNDYDWKYQEKKIAHWQKYGADAFFLTKPLKTLVPFLELHGENLKSYSAVAEELDKKHLENLSTKKSPDSKMKSQRDSDRLFWTEKQVTK